ncbi:MAG: class I mannose-6-phosphate isomerase [Lachnospiraceae bacterium]|nr:class I mannose-6-phosphate isomerase [Lachnospiraceae bacterium]
MEIIRLKPVFKKMIWGGNRLREEFGYNIDFDNCGECWGISAHPNGDTIVAGGEFEGMKLSSLFNERKDLFGNIDNDRFPLLIKIIDAEEDLSIQVHPDDEYAMKYENGSFGKTECWYVIDALPDTKIIIGHNAKDKAEVKDMIENKRWNEFIREIPVSAGDFFMIRPGTVHAIKGGTLILETQQSSDITYRVYDYDRLQDGKPRELHIRQSIDVIEAPFVIENRFREEERKDSCLINHEMINLGDCEYFTVWRLDVQNEADIIQDRAFMLMSVIEGFGYIDGEFIKKGDHFILPYGYGRAVFKGNLKIIASAPHN